MYQIREVTLKNGPTERNVLVIDFDDPKMKIVGEFLMADASMLQGKIIQEIDFVLNSENQTITSNGNRCSLKIGADTTIISDLFNGMDGVDVYPSCEIETMKFRDLIVMWLTELKNFRQG
ncbi:MAG TPA: hypothetical protein VK135_02270 [Candidatus Dormibacteraeota bacterium]|nr:hypothetical protein [Candidatus Dormibacteraeota bacterium]